MDTLIFAGLFVTLTLIVGRGSRVSVVAAWSVTSLATVWLMAHHITGGLAPNLNH